MLELYKGLQAIFRPETLAHFDAVEEFHQSLAVNRRTRLERDRAALTARAHELQLDRERIAVARDRKLQSLQGKRALDEYASLARHIAALEEERLRLHDYLNLATTLQQRAQKIRERKVEEDRDAAEYVASNPSTAIDKYFRAMAEIMYPHAPAGIVIENNTGDNQIRYDLAVQIEGHDSDGINAARIICFDWALLMHGANHTMGFIWHDNRLFADIDPKPRAAWFKFVAENIAGTGKQYIASLNTENYDAMGTFMDEGTTKIMADAIKLMLRGDKPENKLLGIQFGSVQ